ncbi:unnamed protein product [Moneuplotes crassus]|uniref:Uncharacterized protein n=1 Tax=Euplotes crassus TaxID=5936 RepID=A0AAD1Y6Z2_EUPCR|nr:unnamed protein product [Moneuplotes crassus]
MMERQNKGCNEHQLWSLQNKTIVNESTAKSSKKDISNWTTKNNDYIEIKNTQGLDIKPEISLKNASLKSFIKSTPSGDLTTKVSTTTKIQQIDLLTKKVKKVMKRRSKTGLSTPKSCRIDLCKDSQKEENAVKNVNFKTNDVEKDVINSITYTNRSKASLHHSKMASHNLKSSESFKNFARVKAPKKLTQEGFSGRNLRYASSTDSNNFLENTKSMLVRNTTKFVKEEGRFTSKRKSSFINRKQYGICNKLTDKSSSKLLETPNSQRHTRGINGHNSTMKKSNQLFKEMIHEFSEKKDLTNYCNRTLKKLQLSQNKKWMHMIKNGTIHSERVRSFSAVRISHSSNNPNVPLKQIFVDRTKINIKTDDYMDDRSLKIVSQEKSPMEQSGSENPNPKAMNSPAIKINDIFETFDENTKPSWQLESMKMFEVGNSIEECSSQLLNLEVRNDTVSSGTLELSIPNEYPDSGTFKSSLKLFGPQKCEPIENQKSKSLVNAGNVNNRVVGLIPKTIKAKINIK